MSDLKQYIELKYDGKKQTLQDVLKSSTLPVVARTCLLGRKVSEETEIPQDRELLFQGHSEETFAHIKVLKFYDNDKKEKEHGAEYVLEHETFVGNEYLLPLGFGRLLKYARKPDSRGRYLSIKQVVGDCPAFVRAEDETKAHLSSGKSAIIPAKTVLELKRIYQTETHDICVECSDGSKTYTLYENEKVNFSVVEKSKFYNLSELSRTTLLPKVIVLQDVKPGDIVLTDNELRSAMTTIVDGPIHVLGFVRVKYLTCWIRNKNLKTYETILIPELLWNNTYIQTRYFHNDEDKEQYILRKYGPCLKSDFVRTFIYVLPLNLSKGVWLRSPDFFEQKLEGNVFFDVIKVPYTDSSDEEDNVYAEIEEPLPEVPKRDKKGTNSQVKTQLTDKDGDVSDKNQNWSITNKSKENTINETSISLSNKDKSAKQVDGNEAISKTPYVLHSQSSQNESSTKRDQKYTLLEFPKTERVYERLGIYGDTAPKLVPLGHSEKAVDKTEQYIELGQVRKVLDDKQTKEDFFTYTVKEVSFCFEHCGLKDLADMCYKKKLDGSFFKGFDDWKELNLSSLDLIIVKKVINDGWRSNDDSSTDTSTHM